MRKLYALTATAVLAGVATLVAPASAVTAVAPACRVAADPAPDIVELPWAQGWLQPERLRPLADGRGVTVAVVDSGVDASHPQLRGRVATGLDALSGAVGESVDCDGHGTAVASIVAAAARPGVGFAGLAPRASILPVRVAERGVEPGGRESPVDANAFAAGLRWAVDHGADIVNVSVVFYEDHRVIADAVRYAHRRDVVVVAAVGNRHDESGAGVDATPYPAAYPGVIGVGAVGADGGRLSASYTGEHVDLVAPGDAIIAAVRGAGHGSWTGTSFAAPFVSAAAALLVNADPDAPAALVAERLLATADPAGAPREYGRGIVNPYRALTERLTSAVPVPPHGLTAPSADPAALARTQRWQRAGVVALSVTAAALAVAALALAAAPIRTRGRRRGWRPTRTAAAPPSSTVDDAERRFFTVPTR